MIKSDDERDNFERRLVRMFNAVPHTVSLGLSILKFDLKNRSAAVSLPFRTPCTRDTSGSAIEWAAVTSLIDTACSLAVCTAVRRNALFATIDLSVERALPILAKRDIVANAMVSELENEIAILSASASHPDGDRPLAIAKAGFFVPQSIEPSALVTDHVDSSHERTAALFKDWFIDMNSVPSSKYFAYLGMRSLKKGGERAIWLPFRSDLTGNQFSGAIHGGVLASLLEHAAQDYSGAFRHDVAFPPLVVDIDFLRPAGPADLFAACTSAISDEEYSEVNVEAWQTSRLQPVARAMFKFAHRKVPADAR